MNKGCSWDSTGSSLSSEYWIVGPIYILYMPDKWSDCHSQYSSPPYIGADCNVDQCLLNRSIECHIVRNSVPHVQWVLFHLNTESLLAYIYHICLISEAIATPNIPVHLILAPIVMLINVFLIDLLNAILCVNKLCSSCSIGSSLSSEYLTGVGLYRSKWYVFSFNLKI
jgi:hypothetical protein